MKKLLIILTILVFGFSANESLLAQDASSILDKIDQNMSSDNRMMESQMIIYGKRKTRTIESKAYAVGTSKSFTEYLSPARERGTKMLKLEKALWIYSPSTDRMIKISGHMLRQSVMGSDLSYEDMMDDRKMTEVYSSTIIRKDSIDNREVYEMELLAIVEDVAYHKLKLWVDTERFVPLKQEMYAKSGKLLKRLIFTDVQNVENRWFPMKFNYKDMLKKGKGTDFIITKIKFDIEIPKYIFTKASLKQ